MGSSDTDSSDDGRARRLTKGRVARKHRCGDACKVPIGGGGGAGAGAGTGVGEAAAAAAAAAANPADAAVEAEAAWLAAAESTAQHMCDPTGICCLEEPAPEAQGPIRQRRGRLTAQQKS